MATDQNNIVLRFMTNFVKDGAEKVKSFLGKVSEQSQGVKAGFINIGKAASKMGEAASASFGVVFEFFRGGIWAAAGRAVGAVMTKCIDWWKEYKRVTEEARNMSKGIFEEYRNHEAMVRGYERRVARYEEAQKKRIEAEKKAADAEKEAAEKREKLMQKRIADAERLEMIEARIANAESASAVANGEMDSKEASRAAKIRDAEAALRVAKSRLENGQRNENGDYDSVLFAEWQLALANLERVRAEVRREAKDDAEAAAKAAEEAADAMGRAHAQARADADERAKAQEKKDAAAKAQEKRDALMRREVKTREDAAAKILEIEKRIAEEKDRAAKLEEEAAKARGKTVGQWLREQREESKAKEKEQRKQANREKNAAEELARLEASPSKLRTKWQKERIGKLREWLADQDPNNNPALQEAKRLEKEREELRKKMADDLKQIKEDLKKATNI